MNLLNFLGPAFGRRIAGLALVLAAAAFSPAQAAIIVDFTGNCTFGCTGAATGTLTLVDTYVLGTPIVLTDIVGFDYSSNATFGSIFPTSVGGGSIVPGSTAFDIADGNWEFRVINGTWDLSLYDGLAAYIPMEGGNLGEFTVAGVPEPSSFALIGCGVAVLATRRRKRQ